MSQTAVIENIDFTLAGINIHGLACGSENDDLVLCLHGWLDNAASFIPLMTELKGKRVIAIDWPGHGWSSHRDLNSHYHFIDYVYDLLSLFELNQWPKIAIVAHSMGAMVASAFTAAFPEKVSTLTIIDSIGLLSAEAEETTKQLRLGMQSRLKTSNSKKTRHHSRKSAIDARMAVSDLQYPQAELIINRGLKQMSDGLQWRSDQRLRNISPYRFTLQQAEQLVGDLIVPVQLIYGDKGLPMVKQAIKHFSPLITDFQSHQLIGGHHIHMEQAQASAALILTFLANR